MALSSLPGRYIGQHAQLPGNSGIIRVVYSPKNEGIITFEVELNGINVDDGFGKDVNINWSFDDFDEEGKFFTDSNALEMIPR